MTETAWSRITVFVKEKRITWSVGNLRKTLARGQAATEAEARQAVQAVYRQLGWED